MRPVYLALAGLGALTAGCVTVHVHVGEAGGAEGAGLRDARRTGERRVSGLRQEALDALTETALRIATDVQAWALRPRAFGGGEGAFLGASFPHLGYQTDAEGRHHTLDGAFVLVVEGPARVRVVGEGARFGQRVTATVTGTQPEDLRLDVTQPAE
jgi:hypothetical protein